VNRADRRAKIVKAMHDATGQKPERIWDPPWPPGIAAYRVAGVLCVMPELLPKAPASIRRAYRDRIVANATGRCPRCGAVADSDDLSSMRHEHGCPVSDAGLARWISPEGQAVITSGLLS
jgi:hypothetical protein